jgi:hypothetical protein
VNLSQMRLAVLDRLGVSPADTFYTAQQLNGFINEALSAVSNEEYWPWAQGAETLTTVAGTASYAPLDATWNATKALYISGFDPMTLCSLQEVDAITVQGQPVQYAVFQEKLILSPTPDGVYSITHQYMKSEPDLTSDTSTPLMPSEFHWAIVAFAAHLAHMRAGEVDYYRGNITGKAAASLQEYRQWVDRMRAARRRSTAPLRPRIRPGSWI